MKEWDKNVTHVIVGRGAGSSWNRSFEVLTAILLGKWVVHFECEFSILLRQFQM
jgi:BRCA1-associated RING domain protein 1